MKNRLISFIIIVTFLLSIVFKARAESELTVDDRAQIGEIYSLEKLKKFDEALFKIDDLLKRYPDNREVKWTYARLLGFSGKWKDSSDVFDDLCARGCEENELLTYAHILQAQGHDPETLEYMKKLADTHPDDKKIQAIYTEMLVRKRKAPTAGIITAVPVETVSPQTKRVESLISEQKFDQALDELENILSASPEDEAALLWKARILSWRGRYASSVQTYEHLISVHPDRAVYYRECGRVLGWSGKYGRAERIYNKAADRFPENKGLQAEALAKKAYYHDLFFVAEKRYQDWLNYEPENPEALFDLGQIYARSKRYTEAEAVYAKLVKNYSDNAQARRTREKADIFAHAMSTDTGVLRQEIDSQSRQADLRLYDIFSHWEGIILGNTSVGLNGDELEYHFSTTSSVIRRQRYEIFLGQMFYPDIYWKAGYGFSRSSDDKEDLEYRDAEIQFPFFTERFLWNLSYKRDDMIQNEMMFNEHLQADQYRLRTVLKPVKFIEIGADGSRSELSDGNRLDFYGGDAAVHLSYDPDRVTVRYRWQDSRYQEPSPIYFSPDDFISKRPSIEWQHTFNRNELYWGANQIWSLLKFEYIMDPHNVRGYAGTAGFHWDLNKRLALRVQWQHTEYENSSVYKEDAATGAVQFHF